MEYFREELFPCVSLTAVQTDKFKTGCMTAYLLTQLHRETAAENAVLPYVLRRGTKSLPDMRRISERLDALYGAEIEPSVRKLGEIQAVGFYAGFAEDAFLPGETDVLGEVISLLSELWLSPATRGGLFLPAYVDSEREQLVERIERVKNDKCSWAFRRLRENMCAYEDYATGAYGTADEAGSIHYVKLTKHYKELLAVSPMEIFYCGSRPGKEVAAMLREAFALLPRGEIDLDLGTDIRMNAVEEKPRYFTEEDEISQGVLAVGFRLGECMDDPDPATLAVFNAVFLLSCYRTAYKVGVSFVKACIVMAVAAIIMEAAVHFPALSRFNGYDLACQLPLLAAGLVIWCGSWPLIFRGAAARYEKVDL